MIAPAPGWRTWPGHPKPLPDELLSSWLVRLAEANGLEPGPFVVAAFPAIPVWERDIDGLAPPDLLSLLSERTGATARQVMGTTLRDLEGSLFEFLGAGGRIPWVLPIGIRSRRRLRGLQYCPRCLSERVYFRRSWRLAFTVVCPQHYCCLLDRCHRCGSPVELHSRYDRPNPRGPRSVLGQCWNCGARLESARVLRVASNHRVIRHQRLLEKALTEGWAEIGGQRIRALLFFKGLRVLAYAAISNRIGSDIQHELNVVGRREASAWRTDGSTYVEELPWESRFRLVDTLPLLLQDWPNRFLKFADSIGLTASRINPYEHDMPFWLSSIVREHLSRAPYVVNEAELVCITKYLGARGRPITRKALREFCGVRFDKRPQMWRRVSRVARALRRDCAGPQT